MGIQSEAKLFAFAGFSSWGAAQDCADDRVVKDRWLRKIKVVFQITYFFIYYRNRRDKGKEKVDRLEN